MRLQRFDTVHHEIILDQMSKRFGYVREIDLWMVSNKLKLNRDKTELLIINARHHTFPSIDHTDVSKFKIQPIVTLA